MNTPAAVLFDYGNTLLPFGAAQQRAQSDAMLGVLEAAGLRVEEAALNQLRHEQILRPYTRDGVENDFREVCHEVAALATTDPPESLVRALMRARHRAFVDSVELPPELPALLERLRRRHRLGVLSNYPCADSVVDSLRHLGLIDYFEAVVVSGAVGFAKPHPAPFHALLNAMKVDRPADAVYVGDNWLADVQGAKRLGLRAVWLRAYSPAEDFAPAAGDWPADGILTSLADLEIFLEGGEAALPP